LFTSGEHISSNGNTVFQNVMANLYTSKYQFTTMRSQYLHTHHPLQTLSTVFNEDKYQDLLEFLSDPGFFSKNAATVTDDV
jgi:hypothetical protein